MSIIKNILVITFFVLYAAFGSEICNSPGVCVNSTYLGSIPTNRTIDCFHICRIHEYCNYATYSADYQPNQCLLFQTCEKLDTNLCSNCLTSGIDCAYCDVTGICTGKILHTETTPDKLSCWSLCKSNDHCAWFSYGNIGNDCILLESCPDIEENQHFISGEKNCQYRQDCNSLQGPYIDWFDAQHLQFGCIGFGWDVILMESSEAEKYCVSRGYRLVEIYNQNQQDFIVEKCTEIGPGSGEGFWIGLERTEGTSTWKWLDSGLIPEFTAWGPNQPGNNVADELLANAHFAAGYKWADLLRYNHTSAFPNCKPICQKIY